MIKLYIADTRSLDIEAAMPLVSERRRQKVLRLSGDEKKRQSLAAELLLREAAGSVEYCVCENGKPRFEAEPPCFSLSHSGAYAVCAIADTDIGVDIEAPREGSLRLAERFFAEDEKRLVESSDAPDSEFCRLWVQKESFIKMRGGRLADMAGFSVLKELEGCCLHSFEYDGYFIGLCLNADSMDDIEIIER